MTENQPCCTLCRELNEALRGTGSDPGMTGKLYSAERRITKLEENEQTLKEWDKERLRLWIFVVVSILTGLVSLGVNIYAT